jgi:hypothetical protein
MVATLAVAIELWEQLLARDMEAESRKGAIATWEDGMAALLCALGRVHTECDTSHI